MNNFTAVIFILAALGVFVFYTHPAYQKETGSESSDTKSIIELRRDRDEYNNALQKSREVELARTGLLEQWNGIAAADRERLLKLLPDHIDSVRLIIDINSVASKHGMSLGNLDIGAAQEEPISSDRTLGPSARLSESFSFGFSLEGSYDVFRAFLRDIEESLRVIDLFSLSFESADSRDSEMRGEESGKGGVYAYQLVIQTYRLP